MVDMVKSRIKCADIMSTNVSTAPQDATLKEVANLLQTKDIGVVPIVEDDGKLCGLVTDRDIVVRAVAKGFDVNKTQVVEIMTTDLFCANPDDFAFKAIRIMGDQKVRRVPIVDSEDKLLGIVSMADVALEMEDEREIAETLEEISSGKAFWNK